MKDETNKNELVPTVKVQLIPPPSPRRRPIDARKALKKLVEQQVAEIMARREDFVLRPFFDKARVSNEIKRLQTVPEQRKWSLYFSRYGCLRCQTRTVPHANCGMCAACTGLTRERLKRILERCEREDCNLPQFSDRDEIARLALAPASKELDSAKRGSRTIGRPQASIR